MTDDKALVELIRAAASHGPELIVDPTAVRAQARVRRTRRRLLYSTTAALVLASTAVVIATAGHNSRPSEAASRPPSSTVPRHGAPLGPGCEVPFDVTPTGGRYDENGVIATVDPNQPATIVLTMRVAASEAHVEVSQLLLLVGPASLGTDPFPAKVGISLFSGQARNGQRLPATFRIATSGRYPVLAYSKASSACTAAMGQGELTSAQPLGYVVVR